MLKQFVALNVRHVASTAPQAAMRRLVSVYAGLNIRVISVINARKATLWTRRVSAKQSGDASTWQQMAKRIAMGTARATMTIRQAWQSVGVSLASKMTVRRCVASARMPCSRTPSAIKDTGWLRTVSMIARMIWRCKCRSIYTRMRLLSRISCTRMKKARYIGMICTA